MIALWIIYTLIAAVMSSGAVIIERKALLKEHAMEFSTALALTVLILSIPMFFFIDYSKALIIPAIIIFFLCSLGALAFLFAAKGIRHLGVGISSPLLALAPIISTLLAFIFLDESLSIVQLSGLALVILGAYTISTTKISPLEPFKHFIKSKKIYYIIISFIIYGISSFADRVILSNYNITPLTYIAIAHIGLAFWFTIFIIKFHDGFRGIKKGIKNNWKFMIIIAILLIIARLSYASAVKIEYIGLVHTLKQISALITVVVGGELLHEHGLKKKIISTIIILIGVALITL